MITADLILPAAPPARSIVLPTAPAAVSLVFGVLYGPDFALADFSADYYITSLF